MFIELQTENALKPIFINTQQITTINGRVIKMSNQDIITLTEDAYKELLLSVLPKQKRVNEKEADSELMTLFNELHVLTKGKGKAVFSLQREKKLSELLNKHRMTKELLLKAAENIGNDAFLQGDNDSKKRYGDVDYLLRPDKAAKWSEETNIKKKPGMFN